MPSIQVEYVNLFYLFLFWCLRLPFLGEFAMRLEKPYWRNNLEMSTTICRALTWRQEPWNRKKPKRKSLLLKRRYRGLRLWRRSYLSEQPYGINCFMTNWYTNLTDHHPRLKGFINDIPSCKQQISDLGMRNCTELVAWYMPFSLGGLGCLIQPRMRISNLSPKISWDICSGVFGFHNVTCLPLIS